MNEKAFLAWKIEERLNTRIFFKNGLMIISFNMRACKHPTEFSIDFHQLLDRKINQSYKFRYVIETFNP